MYTACLTVFVNHARNMIKAYYTSSFLFDALKQFGELPDQVGLKHFVLDMVICIRMYVRTHSTCPPLDMFKLVQVNSDVRTYQPIILS